jgi:type IV pilus assembly protein PilZ
LTENRQHPRKSIVAEVAFETGEGPRTEARCRDLSLGGTFIETRAPLHYGATLRLHLPLPGLRGGATIDAVVRWSTPDGMGVQFGRMGARETHALTLLLAGR